MKSLKITVIISIIASSINVLALQSGYKEVSQEDLKATPEKYSNRRIFVITKYLNFVPNYSGYIERSGFKSSKYYYVRIVPATLPAMIKKKSKAGQSIPNLKRGVTVKISGRIKKFSYFTSNRKYRRRRHFRHSKYYFDVDQLEVFEPSDEKEPPPVIKRKTKRSKLPASQL